MGKMKGVLCHITSLPNQNLKDAQTFISLLSKNNIDAWQMLPITPPDIHGSPYSSPSAFAGWSSLTNERKCAKMDEEDYWLNDWALFTTIKSHFKGLPWTEWPEPLKNRDPDALKEWKEKCIPEFTNQACFQHAWFEMKNLAEKENVKLIGDLPIFVAHDSADVWAHRELFQLDEDGLPLLVAGVPPDYFSEDGQKWGTVLYRWEAHKQENWRWWKERMGRMLRLFDMVRIDHFRGFHSAWAIPTQDENAKNGVWQDGPKDELIQALIEVSQSKEKIIAEDLGIIPQEVTELRIRTGLRGMAVLQFGFDGELNSNPHHPKNINELQVVYTGTHDNNTTLGWWNESDAGRKKRIMKLLKNNNDVVSGCIKLALNSKASMAIIPLQDILKLNSDSRMNTPGTTNNNWKWSFFWDDFLINQIAWFGSLS